MREKNPRTILQNNGNTVRWSCLSTTPGNTRGGQQRHRQTHTHSLTRRLPFLYLLCPLALPSAPPASPSRRYPTPSRRSHTRSSFSAAHSAWSHRGALLAVCSSSSQPILLGAFFPMSHLGCYTSPRPSPPLRREVSSRPPTTTTLPSFSPRFSYLPSLLIRSPFQISLSENGGRW